MNKITIKKPGLLSTIQDAGRWGFQKYGMPVSGAMDLYSLRRANELVGNGSKEACIEATMDGPTIEFFNDGFIAICGADMQATLDGNDIEMYKTVRVNKGSNLSFKGLKTGLRTYIAFSGGINVPVVMGSKSTYLRGKIGGFQGRKLQKGDEIEIGTFNKNLDFKKVPKNKIPFYKEYFTARIIPGPEAGHFTVKGLADFLNSEYTLTEQCDRMGYRLTGTKIRHRLSADIISSGIAFGTIQVPSHGDPIIMMADRQTIGGYTRIGNIVSEDLPYIAQLKPGDKISFKEVKLNDIY